MITTADRIELTAALTLAWSGNPNTHAKADDVSAFMVTMHNAIVKLTEAAVATNMATVEHAGASLPAISVSKSLASPDFIVSMIDGKPYKALGRHLRANGLTPTEYRQRYGLNADYPMVAPAYSAARSAMAKRLGLGRKPGGAANIAKAITDFGDDAPPVATRGSRKTIAEAKEAAMRHLKGR